MLFYGWRGTPGIRTCFRVSSFEGERSWWEVTTSMGFSLLSFAATFPEFQ